MARLTMISKSLLVLGIWFGAGACGFSLLAQQPGKGPQPKNPGKQPANNPGNLPPANQPNQPGNQPGNQGQNNGFPVSPFAPKVYTFPSYTGYIGGGTFQNAGNPSSFVPGGFNGYPNYLNPGFQPGQMSPYPAYFNNPTLAGAGIPWNQFNFTNPYIMQPNALNPFMNPMMNVNTNPFGNNFNPFNQGMIGMPPFGMQPFGMQPFGMGVAPVVGVGFQGNNLGVGVGNNLGVGVGGVGMLGPGGFPFNPALGFRP